MDDDDRSSVSSRSSRRNIFGGSSSTSIATSGMKKKKSGNDDDDDNDDWKPNFNNKNDDGEEPEDTTNPFDVPNPFDEKPSTSSKSSAIKTKGNSTHKSITTTSPDRIKKGNKKDVVVDDNDETENNKNEIEDPFTASDSVEHILSPEAIDWKKELIELQQENKTLKQREENLLSITNKAEFYANEAKRLETLLISLQQQQTILIQQKDETEAELKGRIAENEILVQEVINSKMSLVEISTQLDVTKKTCYQLKNKLGVTNNRLTGVEVNAARQQQQQVNNQRPVLNQQQNQQQRRPN